VAIDFDGGGPLFFVGVTVHWQLPSEDSTYYAVGERARQDHALRGGGEVLRLIPTLDNWRRGGVIIGSAEGPQHEAAKPSKNEVAGRAGMESVYLVVDDDDRQGPKRAC
jgi:hypothetical protein